MKSAADPRRAAAATPTPRREGETPPRARALVRLAGRVTVAGALGAACAVGETGDTTGDRPGVDGGSSDRITVPEGGATGSSDGGRGEGGPDDEGIDYGPPGPIGPPTGSACSKAGEELVHTCGQCGRQVAVCIDGAVGPYGPCRDEKRGPDHCIPGVSSTETCGYCGTRIRACRNDCTWTETKCKGETGAADRCMPGTVERRLADCDDGEERTYTCAETCAWAAPSACAPSP
ncbi:MAG: hypothetical protein KF850_40450 [Labilithrix sp.]|nr:hypothetical protein [Labilithrix sp.]